MALSTGTRLGPYEIVAPLGAGGMGEVYRARDTRLARDVAIKVLPPHLSERPEAKERFNREARAVSALSHPNICHLYDVGKQDEISYLVMEYLEGQTLADRLARGPLPLNEAIKVGAEICDGLEAAHRNGVLHRDLKPGNVMLTRSGAKLMDFGLAKSKIELAAGAASKSAAATLGQPLTTEGTIVGTLQYMSPEQIEGKEADVRSDVFALGVTLYEMITGQRAFEGKTPASTAAAILASDPKPISAVQPLSTPALEHVVSTCLTKDPEERWQTVHDVKVELRWAAGGSVLTAVPTIHGRIAGRVWAGWTIAVLLLLLLLLGSAAWWRRAHQARQATYYSSPFRLPASDLALSPDARTVALVAYSEQLNKYVIWAYSLGGRAATPLPGTEDASHPFWSPDGRSIAFFAQGKLKKVEVSGANVPQVICDAPRGRGGTWNQDGVIVFAPEVWVGLLRVSASGGTPVEITKPDPSRFEMSHRWPSFLPDGRHFLYLAANFSGEFDKNAIYVGSLDSNERRFLVAANSNAVYADPGYLLYLRDKTLVAQKFDPRTLTLSGEPRALSDEVQYLPAIDLGIFSVAGDRTMVLQTGKGADKSQLTWFDRSGKALETLGQPGLVANPAISPDGRRIAFEQISSDGRNIDIWTRELASSSAMRFTFGPGLSELPIWSPDGKRIVFNKNFRLGSTLAQKNADGSGSEQQIAESATVLRAFLDWSRDGKYLLVWKQGELGYLALPDQHPRPLFRASWLVNNAQFSPDGKWLAYSSNETGSWEVYVTPFPNATSKWQVSSGGGAEPRWRRDGKELFYISGTGKLMAIAVKTTANDFASSWPQALFQTHLRQPISGAELVSYDVSSDGQKFLINTKVDEPGAAVSLSIVLNWAAELERQ